MPSWSFERPCATPRNDGLREGLPGERQEGVIHERPVTVSNTHREVVPSTPPEPPCETPESRRWMRAAPSCMVDLGSPPVFTIECSPLSHLSLSLARPRESVHSRCGTRAYGSLAQVRR